MQFSKESLVLRNIKLISFLQKFVVNGLAVLLIVGYGIKSSPAIADTW